MVTLSTVHQTMFVVDRVNNNQLGAKKCNQSEPVLHRFYTVSSGRDCVIDRVTLSAAAVDDLLTGSPCQQWGLMLAMLTGSPCQQWGLMFY